MKSKSEKTGSSGTKAGVIPSGLIYVKRRQGIKRLWLMISRIGFSYLGTMLWLLRKRGIKAMLNFLYIKFFVATGDGAGGAAFFILGPVFHRFPLLVRMPGQVEVEITTVCDKKCVHCEHQYWDPKSQPRKNMKFEEVKKLVDQLPGLKWIGLVGEGSNFLNKDFFRMVEYVKSKEIQTFFTDHLSDWGPETAERVVKLGVDGVYVSMDAARKETYERLKVGCNYDNVIRNVKELLKAKKKFNSCLPEICFRYIFMKPNVNEIPEFVDVVRKMGSRREFGKGSRIGFSRLMVFDEIKHLDVGRIPEKIIERAEKKARECDLHVIFTGSNVQEEKPPPYCCLAWMEPYIMMDGYVLPCCAIFITNNRIFLREHAFGNVFKTPFRDIWNSERYRKFRQTVNREDKPVPLLCKGCRIYNTSVREKKYGVDEDL